MKEEAEASEKGRSLGKPSRDFPANTKICEILPGSLYSSLSVDAALGCES
jgi:hypothetical protein